MESDKSKVQIGLDRLVIGMPYPKPPKANNSNPLTPDLIEEFAAKKTMFVAQLKYIENVITNMTAYHCAIPNKDLKRYKILSDNGGLLCIFSLGFSYGTGVINFELNPDKLTPNDWAEIEGLLAVTFDDHFEELYHKGVVSHAEFYVDVPDVDLANFVLIDTCRRTTTRYLGTTYHGRRSSPHVATMYDKGAQLKIESKLIRIETRINRRDIRFKDLIDLSIPNPFDSIFVVPANALLLVAHDFKQPALASKIKEFGVYGAIKNSAARKSAIEKLKVHTVSWWQPEMFWATHQKLLQKFKPNFMSGSLPAS